MSKPTREQKKERLDLTFDLLSRGWYIYEIRRELKDKYGVSRRTCDRYLSHAREELAEDWGVSIYELRTAQATFYRRIMRDESVNTGIRMKAASRIDKLFGLEKHLPQESMDWREMLKSKGIDPEEASNELRSALRDALGKSNESD